MLYSWRKLLTLLETTVICVRMLCTSLITALFLLPQRSVTAFIGIREVRWWLLARGFVGELLWHPAAMLTTDLICRHPQLLAHLRLSQILANGGSASMLVHRASHDWIDRVHLVGRSFRFARLASKSGLLGRGVSHHPAYSLVR